MRQQARKIIETTLKSIAPDQRRPLRSHVNDVQALWRRHGWLPPTEMGKDFRASLKNTVDRQALTY